MSKVAPVADLALEQVRLAAQRRKLSHDELARLAGVHPRTVERLLAGETLGQSTLEKVAAALGVQLDPVVLIEARVLARLRQRTGQDRTRTDKNGQERTSAVVIYGWREAARRLRMTTRSLRRYRRAAGDTTEVPWWEDEDALWVWFRGLTAAIAAASSGATTASDAPAPIR